MATFLMRLCGPLQSWGTTSRFDERDTGKEPSKSGVLGILAAALGIDRCNWQDLEPLTTLKMAVRHDLSGTTAKDYQTAGCARVDRIAKAGGGLAAEGVVSTRHFLSGAAFLVGLEGDNLDLFNRLQEALQNPVWPLWLGRKSYLPSEPLHLPLEWNPIQEKPLLDVLKKQPWIKSAKLTKPDRLLLSIEGEHGAMRLDQPIAAFSERRFGPRFVRSEWIDFPGEEGHVSA